ncbi:hypothetical protein ST47_g3330 [Ascochyta rabiei]|uniref:Uncharacterized protein n=1 Tax=Didymella rabiei TaxID=5454 RepID=A0A163I2R6_DIDRA|nr:hypothetical protein ST47_g3330 [Ascochyta rabiei]
MQDSTTGQDVEAIIAALEANVNVMQHTGKFSFLCSLKSTHSFQNDSYLYPLFTKRGVQVLSSHALDDRTPNYRIALRCLNNVLARSIPTRQIFVDEDYPERVVNLMKIGTPDDELATASLLLHSSVHTTLDLTTSFEHYDLADTINKNILRHAQLSTITTDEPASALASLRLLSTLAIQYEAQAHRFLPTLHPILDMLSTAAILSPPLQPPVSLLVSCLASIPIEQARSFSDSGVDRLMHILLLALDSAPPPREKELLPLFMALLRIAQSGLSRTRERLSEHLLPTSNDRDEPLGKGVSLPHRVLKLSGSSVEAELRELILLVFFALSDRDPARFVRQVGYGNAAGFMAAKGIHFPQDELERSQESESGHDFNPVTGQNWHSESDQLLTPMSAEEREREAERLFVLFERLRSTGVVDVENPVAQMQRTGQLEELPDDTSE